MEANETAFNIWIINGPNLNLLGIREPKIYGKIGFDDFLINLQEDYHDVEIGFFQSNHEGALIDKLQEIGFSTDGIIFNPAAFTHTSIALRDALAGVNIPFIEVHLSNVHSREDFRQRSYFSELAQGVISGLGPYGYTLALLSVIQKLK